MSDMDEEIESHLYSLIHHQPGCDMSKENSVEYRSKEIIQSKERKVKPSFDNKIYSKNPFKRPLLTMMKFCRTSLKSSLEIRCNLKKNRSSVEDIHYLLQNLPDNKWSLANENRPAPFQSRGLKCLRCFKIGHKRIECSKYKNTLCYICGNVGHSSKDHYYCTTCLSFDHLFSKCMYRKRAQKNCRSCRTKGHWEEICLSQWREYHMTTSSNNINNKNKNTRDEYFMMNTYCYNCGRHGHTGKKCDGARISKHVPNDPCAIVYKDCPSPSVKFSNTVQDLLYFEDKVGTHDSPLQGRNLSKTDTDSHKIYPLYPCYEDTKFNVIVALDQTCSLQYVHPESLLNQLAHNRSTSSHLKTTCSRPKRNFTSHTSKPKPFTRYYSSTIPQDNDSELPNQTAVEQNNLLIGKTCHTICKERHPKDRMSNKNRSHNKHSIPNRMTTSLKQPNIIKDSLVKPVSESLTPKRLSSQSSGKSHKTVTIEERVNTFNTWKAGLKRKAMLGWED